jgi:hypothetical protein
MSLFQSSSVARLPQKSPFRIATPKRRPDAVGRGIADG